MYSTVREKDKGRRTSAVRAYSAVVRTPSMYAQHNIRVNSVHPTGVATPMIFNEHMAAVFAENPDSSAMTSNLLPVPFVEPLDVTNAVVWLLSDKARYITGVALPVDAGFAVM